MSADFPPRGRIAAIDYGHVRLGVAICDAERKIASPLANYTRRNRRLDGEWLLRLADDERIVGFVVGLPVFASGDESPKSLEARKFGDWVAETTGRPVRYFDERFTTAEADTLLGEARLTQKQRKARRDKIAAQLILTAFLEATRGEGAQPLD